MYGVIYKLTNSITGKSYVGQTRKTAATRWRLHCAEAYGPSKTRPNLINTPLCRAIRKYGPDAFELTVLAIADHQEELDSLEIRFVRETNSMRPAGYNVLPGGLGPPSAELTAEFTRQSWTDADIRHRRCQGLRDAFSTPAAKERLRNRPQMAKMREAGEKGLRASWDDPNRRAARIASAAAAQRRPDVREKQREAISSLWWITDGVNEHRIPADSIVADGWRRGRKPVTETARVSLSIGVRRAMTDPEKKQNMQRGLLIGRNNASENGRKGAAARWGTTPNSAASSRA